jgi:flagellar basal body rod protein FlgF
MLASRVPFVSGLIVGIGIGLILGHLTLWRTDPANEELGTAITFGMPPEMTAAIPFEEPFERSATLPDEKLGFHPADDVPSPLANALAIELMEESLPVAPPRSSTASAPTAPRGSSRAAVEANDAPDEPQPLHVPTAEPLDDRHTGHAARLRELIDRELADTPPAQRDIWFESLKDMRQEDVVGILRMWKLFGGPPPGTPHAEIPKLSDRPAGEPPAGKPPTASPRDWSGLVAAARQIHLRNIRMANTIGYKRQVPRFVEADEDGSTLPPIDVVAEIVFQPGAAIPTGHRLDCRFREPGFFFVIENDRGERFYTHNGRFSLGTDRRLVLPLAGDEFVVLPGIVVPENVQDVAVESDGTVIAMTVDGEDSLGRIQVARVLSPHRLVPVANGLFHIHGPIGESNVILMDEAQMEEWTPIASGTLEGSNVDVRREWEWVEQLQRLLAE